MSSGVAVCPEVKALMEEMRLPKCPEERIRLLILESKEEIVVNEMFRQKDLNGRSPFKILMEKLTGDLKDKCRYILYDCHYTTKEFGNRQDLTFIMWGSCNASVKDRMKVASSAKALDPLLHGFKHRLQVCDFDFDQKSFVAENLGDLVTFFEEEECDCRGDHRGGDHRGGDHRGGDHRGDHRGGDRGDEQCQQRLH